MAVVLHVLGCVCAQVNEVDAAALFASLRSDVWCNLVTVFGAARQGKSFLLNCLTQTPDASFRVSNTSDPCTEGADLSSSFMSLPAFARDGDATLLRDTPTDAVRGMRACMRPLCWVARSNLTLSYFFGRHSGCCRICRR